MFTSFVKKSLCIMCENKCSQNWSTNNIFYHFDDIVLSLWRRFGVFKKRPSSFDALCFEDKKICSFIEIKNRHLESIRINNVLIKKIYDSLLFLFKYDNTIKINKFIISVSVKKNNPMEYYIKDKFRKFMLMKFSQYEKYEDEKKIYKIKGTDILSFYSRIKKTSPISINDVECCFNNIDVALCAEMDNYLSKTFF